MDTEHTYLKNDIGKRIKKERKILHYTQERFSELLGVSQKYISEVERGQKMISLSLAIKICTSFHLSLDYLILGKSSKYSEEIHENNDFETLYRLYEICPNDQRDLCIRLLQDVVNNYMNNNNKEIDNKK